MRIYIDAPDYAPEDSYAVAQLLCSVASKFEDEQEDGVKPMSCVEHTMLRVNDWPMLVIIDLKA